MPLKRLLSALPICAALTAISASASPIVQTETYDFLGLNVPIPDGDPSGVAFTPTIGGSNILMIQSVEVTLDISGTYNGDLYAYLQHDSGLSVLLNRSGTTAGNSFGYDDDGFLVTLADSATNNIHTYQDQVTPTAGNQLTGMWQPDGRLVDPSSVVDTDASTAALSVFNTMNANGSWTLFMADLSSGDVATLESFSLTVTGVPEASESALAILAASGLLMSRRRKRQRS